MKELWLVTDCTHHTLESVVGVFSSRVAAEQAVAGHKACGNWVIEPIILDEVVKDSFAMDETTTVPPGGWE